MRYNLFRNINNEWVYFTYIESNNNLRAGDSVNVIFVGEERQYNVAFKLRLSSSDVPFLLLQENTDVAPRKVDVETLNISKIKSKAGVHQWLNNLFKKK